MALSGRQPHRRKTTTANWSNVLGQQLREFRFLGELPVGHVICRLNARNHYLEGAPVHFVAEPAALGRVTDEQLAVWAQSNKRI